MNLRVNYEIRSDDSDIESLTLEPPDNVWLSLATIEDVTHGHKTVGSPGTELEFAL